MLALVLVFLSAACLFAQKQPFTVETMLRISRIGEPVLSPDGRTVAFTVQTVDLDKNTKPKQIWAVALNGGFPRQLTRDGDLNDRPRWAPDSRLIYFVSNRGGSSQIWTMNPDGGNARQITRISTEAEGPMVAPDGKKIVFLSSVYPECGADDQCNKNKLDQDSKSKVKARIYDSLLFRHWNEWQSPRRQHLMAIDSDGTGMRDLTPGTRDVPPFSLGGPDDYAISADSNEVAFTMNADANLAASTNSDIYTVPVAGGAEPKKITNSPGADDAPLYSPDGKYLAFRSQARAGYESDRFRLLVLERATGRTNSLSESLDRWVGGVTWSPDSTRLFYTVEDRGRTELQMIAVTGGGA
jgi:Tol biopolymer transport system component